MERKIKAILFDLNGVFIKSPKLSERLAEKYGISADNIWPVLKEILKKTRLPETRTADVWNPLLEMLHTSQDDLFEFWFTAESLNEDLLSFSQSLKNEGYQIFVLSNNFPERTAYYRSHFPQIFESVSGSYFSWETGLIKPDPKAYEHLLNENKLRGDECIYFDDSEENIQSAATLGIHGYIYTSLEEAKMVISSFQPSLT